MPDEIQPRRPAVPEPASDAKKHAKRVVLSSVAKVIPVNEAESLLGEPEPPKNGPPELPPKTSDGGLIRPVGWTTRPGGTTTIIKLPPKTGTLPRMTSLSPRLSEGPSLPPKTGSATESDEAAKRPAPIKMETPLAAAPTEQESIFVPPAPTAANPKSAETLLPSALGEKQRAAPPPLPPRSYSEKAPAPVLVVVPPPTEKASPQTPHVPPLVPHDSPAPESELGHGAAVPGRSPEPKADPLAQTVRLSPPPVHLATGQAQDQLPLPETPKQTVPEVVPVAEVRSPGSSATKHRLPPRSSATGRVRLPPEAPAVYSAQKASAIPPKTFPATPPSPVTPEPARPLASTPQAIKSSVTPPTIPLQGVRVRPPTIPLRAAPAAFATGSALVRGEKVEEEDKEDKVPVEEEPPTAPAAARAVKKRRRRAIGIAVFYALLVVLLPCLYYGALYFTLETRVEGQVIPPPGMLLSNEVWIVTDFRDLAGGIADDLASDRQIVVQDMQEKLGHVQRAQADVATREGRIRLLKDQIQSDNDEEMSLMKQARDASQQIWDGPGAQLEVDYQSRLTALSQAIAERARANHLQYNPDPSYYSPEVWANAYRLALYEVPTGVDAVKERTWLDAQMKAWHDFTKAMDQKEASLRQQAAQLKLQPSARVTDIKAQVVDLQSRIDATMTEEEPLKAELEQARGDLTAVQGKEAGLDAKPYEMLDGLPEKNVTKRLDLQPNGRFSWREVEKENKYAADEKAHVFWIFARAFRSDGRQYWALNRFSVAKDSTTLVMIEPNSFQSTKAILRPDLSPDEQAR